MIVSAVQMIAFCSTVGDLNVGDDAK